MTWRTVVAAPDNFHRVLDAIRTAGGVITRSCPSPAGFQVTYVTSED